MCDGAGSGYGPASGEMARFAAYSTGISLETGRRSPSLTAACVLHDPIEGGGMTLRISCPFNKKPKTKRLIPVRHNWHLREFDTEDERMNQKKHFCRRRKQDCWRLLLMKRGPVARLEILHRRSNSFDHRYTFGTANSWKSGKLSDWANDRPQRLYQLRLCEANACRLDDDRGLLLAADRLHDKIKKKLYEQEVSSIPGLNSLKVGVANRGCQEPNQCL